MIRFGTFCSGILAPEVAWQPLGWQPQFCSEIDPFDCAAIKHHQPQLENLGDMTGITNETLSRFPVDLVCAGTPCQSFSVAGLRGGMADPRGNLALVFLRLVEAARAKWVVWENVPGVLSSNGGRDFGAFVGGLAKLGYGWAYRILDAQYAGVPQRRRRVFVVGYLGDWRRAAAVLFERHSLSGDSPRRETGARVAHAVAAGAGGSKFGSGRDGQDTFVTGTLQASGKAAGSATQQDAESNMLVTHSLRADGFDASEDGTGRGTPLIAFNFHKGGSPKSTLGIADDRTACEKSMFAIAYRTSGNSRVMEQGDKTAALTTSTDPNSTILNRGSTVRRLTPLECERLQGFPDNYTLVPYRGKPAVDGPRYRAIGNSMAVPVMRWIGERIQQMSEGMFWT